MASLSEENIRCLYRCEDKTKQRQVLAKILDYSTCDNDEDNMKTSVLLDFYLESIHFATERGFSWQQGLAVFELMKELFNSTTELTLLQATEHFKTILQAYASTFTSQRLTSVVDFVFSFFFNHFHLFKFVSTNERDVDRRTVHLRVEMPPQDLPPLGKGTEKSEWECQQVLKKLEEEHNKKIMEKKLQLDLQIEQLHSLVQNKLSLLNTEQPITREELNNIVKETVQIYVAEAGSTIQHLIEESQENLVYEFQKSAVGQDPNRNAKTSGGKTKSPGTVLAKKKVKVAKPTKG